MQDVSEVGGPAEAVDTELGQVVEEAVTQHCKRIDRVSDKQVWMQAGLPALGVAALLMFGGVALGMPLRSTGSRRGDRLRYYRRLNWQRCNG